MVLAVSRNGFVAGLAVESMPGKPKQPWGCAQWEPEVLSEDIQTMVSLDLANL
jgi:hypothetical protein